MRGLTAIGGARLKKDRNGKKKRLGRIVEGRDCYAGKTLQGSAHLREKRKNRKKAGGKPPAGEERGEKPACSGRTTEKILSVASLRHLRASKR